MSDSGPGDEPAPTDPEDTPPQRAITPFVVAAAIAAVILGGIVLTGWLAPVEKNVTDSDRIAGAVREFADVSSRYGPEPPREAVCPGFVPARSPMAGRLQPGETGKDIEITKFGPVQINGENATIEVTSRVEDQEATSTWWLFRSDDDWKVCNQPVE
ncbi:hypothetical protein [Nocardia flavorosea]|uniref:Lumazine-binding protein n=1 Tax=Nocardia flavorosea TaxID=53429 RepID=A0A846YEW7_9NOCA|nr:hypothetical protein [Nocardia flavorosea]NKY56401.1 hypothetical protein [Nocardia flavorosea]